MLTASKTFNHNRANLATHPSSATADCRAGSPHPAAGLARPSTAFSSTLRAPSRPFAVESFLFAIFIFAITLTSAPPSRAAEKREPLNVTSAVQRAQELMLTGKASKALKTLDALGAAGDNQPRAQLTRSMACTMLGMTQEALDSASRAVELSPNDKNALYAKAVALMGFNRDSEAAPIFVQIKKIDSRFAPAYFYSGLIYSNHGKPVQARGEFESALANVTPADAWIKEYISKNYPGVSAAPAASQRQSGGASRTPAQQIYGESAPQSGGQGAPSTLKKIVPDATAPVITRKPLPGIDGPAQKTSSQLKKLPAPSSTITPDKSSSTTYSPAGPSVPGEIRLGRARPKMETSAGAGEDVQPSGETGADRQPSPSAMPQEYKTRLTELYTQGKLDEAAEFTRGYSEDHPGDAIALMDLAALLTATGKYEGALDAFTRANELSPGNAELLTNWGRCLELAGDAAGGAQKYKDAIAANPSLAAPRINLGNSLIDAGKFGDAVKVYNAAIAADPEYRLFYYGLLAALVGKNDLAAAADILMKKFGAAKIDIDGMPQTTDTRFALVSLVISDASATYNLARMLAEYGYQDDAATFYQLFAQTYPGKYSAAEKEARDFLDKHPARERPRSQPSSSR